MLGEMLRKKNERNSAKENCGALYLTPSTKIKIATNISKHFATPVFKTISDNVFMDLAEKLKHRRQELRMTQADLGVVVGKSHKRISEFESRHRVPDKGTLQLLEKALLRPLHVTRT